MAREMHLSVKALLDAVPMSRKVLQGLAAVERALAKDGMEGIDWLPQAVLEKAAVQLKSLPMPAGNKALPQLLALMSLAVATRTARHTPDALDHNQIQFLSSFLCDDKLKVSEASLTDFLRLSDNAEPTGPG
jgi:hypothetical protein